MEEKSVELVEYLRGRTRDSLRVVVHYEDEKTETLYSKDTLSQETVEMKVRDMLEYLRQVESTDSEGELGKRYGYIQVRQEAVLIHVPKTEDEGFLIEFEPKAASKLVGLLDDCHGHISR